MNITLNKITACFFLLAAVTPTLIRHVTGPDTIRAPGVWQKLDEPVVIDIRKTPIKGSPAATTVLIEFSDYECPFCRKHAQTVFRQLHDDFVASGKIRYAFVNYPLDIHPNAKTLAAAAWCSGEQHRYWSAHELLFHSKSSEQSITAEMIENLGLDATAFTDCMQSGGPAQIEHDVALAQKLHVVATPTFAIGHITQGTEVKVYEMLRGAQALTAFSDALKQSLSKGSP